MTSFIIKIILWFPFLVFAFLLALIGNIFYYLLPPFAILPFKASNFLIVMILKDLENTAKDTPVEKYFNLIKRED
jgi:hypothetical protein